MRTQMSHFPARLLVWPVLFAALALLFRAFAPTSAQAAFDEHTVLTVRTADSTEPMTLAEYLPLAVAAEMPVSFGPEALKAQAVAARSYVLAAHRHADADVCTDSACCLACMTEDELRAFWGGAYDENLAAVKAAVAATDGMVLTYEGAVVPAVFHASSSGSTEDSAAVWSALPYLVAVSSPETTASVPNLLSTAAFSPAELAARLGIDSDEPPEAWLAGTELDAAGRVRTLRIAGTELPGVFVRGALGLASTDFLQTFVKKGHRGTHIVFRLL